MPESDDAILQEVDLSSNTIESDPYEVLGLPHGASIKTVRSAYRLLVKAYHPDTNAGDKKHASERLIEIQKAFKTLTDHKFKMELDKQLLNDQSGKSSQEYDPKQGYYESQILDKILEEEWTFACNFHPELVTYSDELNELDPNLAVVFKSLIVTEKLFAKGKEVAQNLETQFLKSKFGDDLELMQIAKKAILAGELGFAIKLNKAIRVLGIGSKAQILYTLAKEHPEFGNQVLKNFLPSVYFKKMQDIYNRREFAVVSLFLLSIAVIIFYDLLK